jgi:hypothetical protein
MNASRFGDSLRRLSGEDSFLSGKLPFLYGKVSLHFLKQSDTPLDVLYQQTDVCRIIIQVVL